MTDQVGKYTINCCNKNNSINLKAVWKHGRVNYTQDAKKIINFLESEIPAGTFCKFKQLIRCEVSAKELLKLQQKMYKLHQDINEKNHEYKHESEDSVFWG